MAARKEKIFFISEFKTKDETARKEAYSKKMAKAISNIEKGNNIKVL